MVASVGWFISLAAVVLLSFAIGCWLGQGPTRRAWMGWGIGFVLLGVWLYLQRFPAVAVRAIPVEYLRYLEGTALVPIFMLIIGVAWARSRRPRQKVLTYAALALGIYYFLHGGLWMIQPTPANAFGRTVPHSPLVMQSQDYSCVPAACATALNELGYPTTEEDMAELTNTRPRSGATLIRAMEGLKLRLEGTGETVELVQPASYEELLVVPLPALTPLHYEAARLHMVTLTHVNKDGVWVADPVSGEILLRRDEFMRYFIGQVLIFHHP
jgi:predicted double-glycine peptidase